MKRWLWFLAIVTVTAGVAVHDTSRGQVPGTRPPIDLGPGEGGATLKLPGIDPVTPDPQGGVRPGIPDSLKGLWNPAASAFPPALQSGGTKVAEPPSNATDINKDIEINTKAGNWVIFVMAYSGPKAPEMARKFVSVMRGHYKWNAYVFNYGAEAKRNEYERVQKIRTEQIKALKDFGLTADMPIRVSAIRVNEQTGVLLGGYKTRDEAIAALEKIRKTDPQALIGKVDLDTVFTAKVEGAPTAKGPKVLDSDVGYVNPFKKAFIARNPHPDVPKEQSGMTPEEELKFLRHVNSDEPLTLLNCKKTYTLAIKQYNMQHKTIDDAKEANSFLDRFNRGLLRTGKEWQDHAAHNAHNLAEGLRKAKLDAYVLHAKYCSYVTVGSYDSLQDPQLVAMQNVLEPLFKSNGYRELDLFPRPVPMMVPGAHVR